MLQQAFSLWFPVILSFIMFSFISVSTEDSNVYVKCSQLSPTSMTPYESNVNSLFASIVDSASAYNFNKFETSPQSDCVYGLFQCRGDLSPSRCKDCVVSAVSQLKAACPTSTGGEIQLEGCFVKYDNTSFFGALDEVEVYRRCGPSIGFDSDVLSRIDAALEYLVGGNGEYFREGDFGSMLGVAQCIQDLSLSDCRDCLFEARGRLKSECETSRWGDIFLGKCYIRYADDEGDEDIANDGDDDNDTDTDNNDDRRRRNRNQSQSGRSKSIKVGTIFKWVGYIAASAAGTVAGSAVIKYVFKPYVFGDGLKDDLEDIKNGVDDIIQRRDTADLDKKNTGKTTTGEGKNICYPYGVPATTPTTTPTACPCSSCSDSDPNPSSCDIM